VQITDRIKDVIKSGGEWISSVELETLLISHPAVLDAAVVGIPDERWSERPLAVVVFKPDQAVPPAELRQFLERLVARFWLPDLWSIVAVLPTTSVGKRDKQAIRAMYAQGQLAVTRLDR
jgi:fatty-acyl-CoA synthase